MMDSALHLGLSISVICNCWSMWWIGKTIRAQSQHMDIITRIVIDMVAVNHIRQMNNVVPFNSKGK